MKYCGIDTVNVFFISQLSHCYENLIGLNLFYSHFNFRGVFEHLNGYI